MAETSLLLEEKKKVFLNRSEALRLREEALRHKDLDLQSALLRIKPLLEENQAKKVRAEKRLAEDEKAIDLKMNEHAEAIAILTAANADVADVAYANAGLNKYVDFLARLQADYSNDFTDVPSILKRHATLTAAHSDLLAESSALSARVFDARSSLLRAQKVHETQALTGANEIARYNERLEAARAAVSRHAAGANAEALSASQRAFELGQTLRSVANLFNRCVKGPYGGVLMHSPADADALGRGLGDTFAGVLSLFADTPDAATASAATYSTSALITDAEEDPTSSFPGGGQMTQALSRKTLKRAPVFIAQAEPKFFAATAALATRDARAAEAAAARESPDATGMEPEALVAKVSAALCALDVVASTLIDFSAVSDGHAQFLAEGRKAMAEKAAAAASEVAKKATAAAVKTKAAAKREAASLGLRGNSVGSTSAGSAIDAVRAKNTSGARAHSPITVSNSLLAGSAQTFSMSSSIGASTMMMNGIVHSSKTGGGAGLGSLSADGFTQEARQVAAQLTRSGARVYFAKTPSGAGASGGALPQR